MDQVDRVVRLKGKKISNLCLVSIESTRSHETVFAMGGHDRSFTISIKRSDRTGRSIMSDRDRSDGESLSDQNDCMETRPEDGCIVTLLVSKGGIDWQ